MAGAGAEDGELDLRNSEENAMKDTMRIENSSEFKREVRDERTKTEMERGGNHRGS